MNIQKIISIFLTLGVICPLVATVDPIDQALEAQSGTLTVSAPKMPSFFEQTKQFTIDTQQIANTLQGVATTSAEAVQGLAPVSNTFYKATEAFNTGSNKIYDTGVVVTKKLEKLPEKAAVCAIGGCVAVTGLALIYKAINHGLFGQTQVQANAPFWKRYPNLIQGTLGSLFFVSGLAMTLKSDAIVNKLS